MFTLILETQEGHQIELNVQPEDTFKDLKSQFVHGELVGLSDSLQQLITGGVSVLENTKIFDFVAGNAQEWLGTSALAEEPTFFQSSPKDDRSQERHPRGSVNNRTTMPEQPPFPLPADCNRLSVLPTEIERLDPYNKVFSSDMGARQSFFLCSNHYGQESLILLTDGSSTQQAPTFTSQKLKNHRSKSYPTEDIILTKDAPEEENEKEKSNVTNDVVINSKNCLLDVLKSEENFGHPGILCRLCGKLAVNPIHLYAVETENINVQEFSLADKINLCLPVTITITDPLPKQICQDCDMKLNVCHDLVVSSLQAEDKLKSLLRKKKFRVDVNGDYCPLCVEGGMRMVKQSGIYRKEDLKNNLRLLQSPINEKKIISSRTNNGEIEIRSWKTKVELPISSGNLIAGSTNTKLDTALQSEIPQDNIIFSQSTGQANCSVCCSKIDGCTGGSIESRNCRVDNRISSRSRVVCKSRVAPAAAAAVDFTNIQELRLYDSRHGLATIIGETSSSSNNSTGIRCDTCGQTLASKEILRNHNCSGVESNKFAMSNRGKYLRKNKLRNSDIMNIASNEEAPAAKGEGEEREREKVGYSCKFCNKGFTQKTSLENHTRSLHNDLLKELPPPPPLLLQVPKCCYKCKVCCEAFAGEKDAEAHARAKHLSSSYFNKEKEEDEVNICCGQSEQLPIEQLIVTRLYVCEYCELRFTVPSSVHEHRRMQHSSKNRRNKYSCTMCDLTFDSHRELGTHKTQHSHREPLEDNVGIKQLYVCKYCDKSFLHHTSHTSHVLRHARTDSRGPYLCRVCNLNFVNYPDISRHRDETHPYYQSILHERSSFVYNCQYCRKEFGQEVALMKHIRMHTGERPYKCTICAKGFSQSSGLYTHLRVHSNVRPFACTKCSRTFKIKGDCDNHMKKHAGNRPYKCEFCNKAFMTQHVYSQHCKIHTNERPYKCHLCGQAFRRSHVLTVHMRRHSGEKPHVCDMCPKTYRQRGDLSKHRKVQHGISGGGGSGAGVTNITKFSHTLQSCGDDQQPQHDPNSDHFPITNKLYAAVDICCGDSADDNFMLSL